MRKILWRLEPVFLAFLVIAGLGATTAPTSRADISVGVSVTIAPPDLPVYQQPPCPGEDYIWTPGYWAWDGYDYYWVPGTWVLAPQAGYFWTPGYWAWRDSAYFWTPGYWGPAVGFYGGIDYGYGYFGHGYEGGRWDRGHFFYNRAVNNVNVTVVHNTYNTTVVNRNVTVNRASFNGGRGGVEARASAQEEVAARERHVAMVAAQQRHVEDARNDRQLRASENHGLPPVAATAKPGDFKGHNVVRASQAGTVHSNERPANAPATAAPNARPAPNANAPRNNNAPRPNNTVEPNAKPPGHVRDLPPSTRGNPPNTGNTKVDKRYAEQQQKLEQRQTQDRQKLEQRQQREDQKIQQQRMNDAKRQQLEQKHQQETQKMVQRQQQQTQRMQKQQTPHPAPAQKPAPKPEHPQPHQ